MNKFHRNSLLIDTNLLLLLLIGSFNPSLIRKNKITANQDFDEDDFTQLRNFAGNFQKLVTTPHILTEVSNHAEKIKGADHLKFLQQFISLIESDKTEEHSESSKLLAKTEAFVKFGLTDTAIAHLMNKNFFFLTVDFPLAGNLRKRGVNVINFNNVRRIPQADWTS
jgi:rRNA-processing protein FCF1